MVAQQSQAPRPRVLAFFTPGGELDHFLFAQQAMRAFGAAAQAGGYAFAATSDWDALNEAGLRDVRVVIWLNDMPHTVEQRLADARFASILLNEPAKAAVVDWRPGQVLPRQARLIAMTPAAVFEVVADLALVQAPAAQLLQPQSGD